MIFLKQGGDKAFHIDTVFFKMKKNTDAERRYLTLEKYLGQEIKKITIF